MLTKNSCFRTLRIVNTWGTIAGFTLQAYDDMNNFTDVSKFSNLQENTKIVRIRSLFFMRRRPFLTAHELLAFYWTETSLFYVIVFLSVQLWHNL